MATQEYFSHTSLDGRSPWDRAEEQGISANGENIAAGRSTASGTLQQWKDSDGHCRNMMNPDFHVFAIGYAYDSSARYRYYWTQMFKRSDVSDLDTSCYPVTTSTSADTTTSSGTSTSIATTASSTTATGTETATGTTTDTATETVTGTATETVTGTATETVTGTATETLTGTTTTSGSLESGTSSVSTSSSISSFLSETSGTTTSTRSTSAESTASDTTSSTSRSFTTMPAAAPVPEMEPELESIEGKLVLEVSDPERFLDSSSQLEGTSTFLGSMSWSCGWM